MVEIPITHNEPPQEPPAPEPEQKPEPEYVGRPSDPKLYAFFTITLEKVSDSGTRKDKPEKPWLARRRARLGEIFTYTYKSLDRNQALQRASAALIREFPDENRMNWKEIR
jgi:hypothetical protein